MDDLIFLPYTAAFLQFAMLVRGMLCRTAFAVFSIVNYFCSI